MRDISNTADTLDVRDIIARVEELREEREDFEHDEEGNLTGTTWADSYEVEAAELATLETLLGELKGNGGDEKWEGDWYPITLIHASYFVEAMKDLCEDIGDLPQGVPSYMVIDWEATAENLRADYTSVEFDGQTFWYR